MVDCEAYRNNQVSDIEVPSGETFKMKKAGLEAYDKFSRLMTEYDLDKENPDEDVLGEHSNEIANALLPSAIVEPTVLPDDADLEKPSEQLLVSEIDTEDTLFLLQKAFESIGAVGKKAKERANFRNQE